MTPLVSREVQTSAVLVLSASRTNSRCAEKAKKNLQFPVYTQTLEGESSICVHLCVDKTLIKLTYHIDEQSSVSVFIDSLLINANEWKWFSFLRCSDHRWREIHQKTTVSKWFSFPRMPAFACVCRAACFFFFCRMSYNALRLLTVIHKSVQNIC